jgi:thiamine biosynthesis lipoprotein
MDEHPPASRVVIAAADRVMATDISVQLAAPPEREPDARAAAQACMTLFREVDERLSRFRPQSELSQLNRAAGRWCGTSELLFAVVAQAIAAARGSGGLFDPTLLYPLEALGYDRDFAQIARREIPAAADTSSDAALHGGGVGGWQAIALDPARRRMRLPHGVGLDLGGIAKGWAADQAFERYCATFPGALVNVGGDLRAHGGPAPGQAWSVGVRDPRLELAGGDSDCVAVIAFSRGGLATSGALSRWWLRGGQRQHHLLDPRTLRPARLWIDGDAAEAANPALIATATALAPTAAQAEVAAKVAVLRGNPDALRRVEQAWQRHGALEWSPPEGVEGLEANPDTGVALLLTFGTGAVALSANMREYLDTWGTQGAPLPLRVGPPGVSTIPAHYTPRAPADFSLLEEPCAGDCREGRGTSRPPAASAPRKAAQRPKGWQ